MALPPGLQTVTVTDERQHPDGGPMRGRIMFQPEVAAVTSAEHGLIVMGPVEGEWIGGVLHPVGADGTGTPGLRLLAVDAAGITPTGWTYRVTERPYNASGRSYAVSLSTALGGSVSLAELAPTAPAEGEYLLVTGPAGPAGPQGEPGPEGPQPPLGAAGAGPDIALRSDDPTTTDARTPLAHAGTHAAAGADPVTPDAIGAPTQTEHDTLAGRVTSVETVTTDLNTYVTDALNRIASLETRMTAAEAETTAAYKFADQANGTTALADDTHLTLPVAANSVYAIDLYLDATADATADIALAWATPAGATMSWAEGGISLGNSNNIGNLKMVPNAATDTSGIGILPTGTAAMPRGRLVTGATAGQLTLRWAQNATSGTPTVLRAGSWMRLTKLA